MCLDNLPSLSRSPPRAGLPHSFDLFPLFHPRIKTQAITRDSVTSTMTADYGDYDDALATVSLLRIGR